MITLKSVIDDLAVQDYVASVEKILNDKLVANESKLDAARLDLAAFGSCAFFVDEQGIHYDRIR